TERRRLPDPAPPTPVDRPPTIPLRPSDLLSSPASIVVRPGAATEESAGSVASVGGRHAHRRGAVRSQRAGDRIEGGAGLHDVVHYYRPAGGLARDDERSRQHDPPLDR